MDRKYIIEAVDHVKASAGDREIAHVLEDRLHKEVLRYIAKNAPAPFSTLAREALKTESIDFQRWYA